METWNYVEMEDLTLCIACTLHLHQAPEFVICKYYYSYKACRYQEIFILKLLQEMFRIQWVGALRLMTYWKNLPPYAGNLGLEKP